MSTATVVPAHRLGQLLVNARQNHGLDLERIAKDSRGEFTVGDLSDIEAGHRLLNDALIHRVTELYDVNSGPIVPQRSELVVDLNHGVMSASGQAVRLDAISHQHVLDRYLSLVYVLRNRKPGDKIPLRGEDIDILAASLAERAELLEEQLLRTMADDGTAVPSLFSWFKNRIWVPGAGAVVGAVSVGTLIIVSTDSPATSAEETSTPLPDGSNNLGLSFSASTDFTRTLGTAAQQQLPFDTAAALPGWSISYENAHPDFRGLTFPSTRKIEIYVRTDDTPEQLAEVLAHEIGHAIDVTYFGQEQRDRWLEARGRSDAPWWPDAFASDFETGAGDFAESFAAWALGDHSLSKLAGQPTPAQLDLVGELIAPHIT